MSFNMTSCINFYGQSSLHGFRDNELKGILNYFINNLFKEYIPCKNRDSKYVTNSECIITMHENEDKIISL